MRLLIYSAGVIGSFYAALFSRAGYSTTVYARGKRLESLERVGLLYEHKGQLHSAHVEVIDRVANEDHFDYIFLTVKENQVHTALRELRSNCSPNIVTMVNTLEPYGKWEEICGTGRIIPAFPGAGGSFQGDVLKAALTPKAIQPTTFGEINGKKTKRLQEISLLLRKAEIPYQIVKNMHDWQLCHLAMVVPIADAYYAAEHPKEAWKEKAVMLKTARQLKHNFKTLHALGIHLSPWKMNLFCFAPVWILKAGMTAVFKSSFGDVFMYQHSMNAPDEMRQLHTQIYRYIADAAECGTGGTL